MDAQGMLNELKVEIKKLKDKFLLPWLPAKPEDEPEQFEHDVKAYCVLTHAIFEEFVEELSLIAMEDAIDAWKKKLPTKGTISLLCAYGACLSIPEKDDDEQEELFTQIRKELDETKTKHSNVLSNNHGFSLKYLRKILTPVGLDIPTDIVLLESLKNLADARGSFAHTQAQKAQYGKWKQAKKPMTPEQADTAVNDCIDLCEKLVDRAVKLINSAPTEPAAAQAPRRKLPG